MPTKEDLKDIIGIMNGILGIIWYSTLTYLVLYTDIVEKVLRNLQ